MITEEEIYNSKNRIQNARVARDNCKKDSWVGHIGIMSEGH